MRSPGPYRSLLLLLALVILAAAPRAHADDRSDARVHYQAGLKFYTGGDYKSAIREFSAAQQLAPADLNNYNLALCYDKLGDAEPAIQYYREYLNKVPSADKKAEIEASIARLEAAQKSAAAKKAEEAKKADDAKKAEDARKEEEARRAEEAKKAEDAKKAAAAGAIGAAGGVATGAAGGVATGAGSGAGAGIGSTGTPSSGQGVSTGDAQLDRAAAIDINAIRDQRMGGAGSGIVDRRGGPATGPTGPTGPTTGPAIAPPPNGQGAISAGGSGNMAGAGPMGPSPNGATSAGTPLGPSPSDKPAPQETPVYKKWWFWAVVAVSAYVVYEIATSSSNNRTARELPPTPNMPGRTAAPAGGFTLFHF